MQLIPTYNAPDFTQESFHNAPDVKTAKVTIPGIAPENYHATSMYPEYFKIGGQWKLLEETRMDCVPVIHCDGTIEAKEFRRLAVGEDVILGRKDDGTQGIYLHSQGFATEETELDAFTFRSGRSRETSFQRDYENLANLLRHDKENGHIAWVLGPAAVFSAETRNTMAALIDGGFAHVIFGGNAVATHDLEAALYGTALGQDVSSGVNRHNGHYHHLDAINAINKAGSIPEAIEAYGLNDGVMCACVRNNVPFVLAGSIRDDGPMAGVYDHMAVVQDVMRMHTKKVTTVVCLATQLHTIATGNLTPSYIVVDGQVRPVFIYAVDISEFVLNKLRDRGSLEVTTIVSNIQDFLFKLQNQLFG